MVEGKRVVVLVPAGERRYSQILARYLELERSLGELDEVRWCLNTTNEEDIAWIRALPTRCPGFHWVVQGERPETRDDLIRMIAVYQDREGRDPNTVYVRIDHDIVYFTPGLIGKMARRAIQAAADDSLLVFPYIINSSHGDSDPPGAAVAEQLHRDFLAGKLNHLISIPAEDAFSGKFSANCMAWVGSRLPSLHNSMQKHWKMHEEYELTAVWMKHTGRPQVIDPSCGLVVHFSYHGQRDYLDSTDLLELYRDLCYVNTGMVPE
jgi:hypothetical protein